jgi:hypothetical protein
MNSGLVLRFEPGAPPPRIRSRSINHYVTKSKNKKNACLVRLPGCLQRLAIRPQGKGTLTRPSTLREAPHLSCRVSRREFDARQSFVTLQSSVLTSLSNRNENIVRLQKCFGRCCVCIVFMRALSNVSYTEN